MMLLLLLGWHALADYPLQGDFLAKAKHRSSLLAGVPWYQAMAAHAMIHAVGVAVITGSVALALAEFVAHAAIDDAKCQGKLSFNMDQALHIGCKLLWWALAVSFL